jgi:AcrR family transcriptional regulator
VRIVKEAEERRNEILDASEVLFGKKGFDHTSTNDILNQVGIARGTLYYHFKSKEDILDAMIERMTGRLLVIAKKEADNKELNVLDRLSRTIMALNVDSSLGTEVLQQVHKPQNALMHQKMQLQLFSGVIPILTSLVEEGIKEGIFHTDYPEEAVEMCTIYSNNAFDGLVEQSPEEMQKKVSGFIYNVERVLGAKEGSMKQSMIRVFKAAE